MKRLLLVAIFSGTLMAPLSAQQKEPLSCIKFDRYSFNFGTLEQNQGLYEYSFRFRNCSKRVPLIIKNVKTACGCTVPIYSKKPVPPGGEGFIKVRFDPNGRPGPFNKAITVYANTTPPFQILRIEGKVKPRPVDPDKIFNYAAGNLKFTMQAHYVGTVKKNSLKDSYVKVFNTADTAITLYAIAAPQYIEAQLPITIPPGKMDSFLIIFRPARQESYGMVTLPYTLVTDDPAGTHKDLYVMADVQMAPDEDPRKLYETNPRIEFEKRLHSFGTVPQGKTVSTNIKFWNSGKGVLRITSTRSSCGCTVTRPHNTTLMPGDTSYLTINFEGRGYGYQQRKVWVYTNDPLQREIMIQIDANVKPRKP